MLHTIKAEQKLPLSLQEAWDFISSPKNLKLITPEYMGFEITSKDNTDLMYPGMIITYKVKPVLHIPLNWATEITHVENLKYFVDEQRFGPYALWHHKHFLKEIAGGVLMTDLVHYKVPGWFFGDIANTFFIKNKLKQIFDYRYNKLITLFGEYKTN